MILLPFICERAIKNRPSVIELQRTNKDRVTTSVRLPLTGQTSESTGKSFSRERYPDTRRLLTAASRRGLMGERRMSVCPFAARLSGCNPVPRYTRASHRPAALCGIDRTDPDISGSRSQPLVCYIIPSRKGFVKRISKKIRSSHKKTAAFSRGSMFCALTGALKYPSRSAFPTSRRISRDPDSFPGATRAWREGLP